jgi:hypothetical protein
MTRVSILLAALLVLSTGTSAEVSSSKGYWQNLENFENCQVWLRYPPWKGSTWTWVGDCLNGKPEGLGKLVWRLANGEIGRSYLGMMKGGVKQGHGSLSYSGFQYLGDIKRNQLNGNGILVAKNGKRYVGQFKKGLPDGHGTFVWANGNRFKGEVKGWGLWFGHGIWRGSNGDKYEGYFKDGKFHGHGAFVAANGDRYEGAFKAGKRQEFDVKDLNLLNLDGVWKLTEFRATGIFSGGAQMRAEALLGKHISIHISDIILPNGEKCRVAFSEPRALHDGGTTFGTGGGSWEEIGLTPTPGGPKSTYNAIDVEFNCKANFSGILLQPKSKLYLLAVEGNFLLMERFSTETTTPSRTYSETTKFIAAAYFTLGSMKDDVVRVQGTPDDIIERPGTGDEEWKYGNSSVYFSLEQQQVTSWTNAGNLKVKMTFGDSVTTKPYFTMGSHQDDLVRVQGTPDQIRFMPIFDDFEIWKFGRSEVRLSRTGRRVMRWTNKGNLKVKIVPLERVYHYKNGTEDQR